MSLLLLILNILLFQDTPGQPDIVFTGPEAKSVAAGETLKARARVYLRAGGDASRIKLLPLALDNMSQAGVSVSVIPLTGTAIVDYAITLVAGEEGSAALGELQFELFEEGENGIPAVSGVLTHPGFSVQVVKPFNYPLLWFAGGGAFIIVIAAASLSRLRARRRAELEAAAPTSRARQVQKMLEDFDAEKMSGEWNKAVETAYSAMMKDVSKLAGHLNIAESSALELVFSEVADSQGLYRLGEEIRYGGYRANVRETRFARQILTRVFDFTDSKMHEENKRHGT